MKNINYSNWKINTVSKSGSAYIFGVTGYCEEEASTGTLWVNDRPIEVSISSATPAEVTFAPKGCDLFFWKSDFLIESKLLVEENSFILKIIASKFPVLFWSELPLNRLIVPEIENIKRVSGQSSNKVTYKNSGRTEYLRYKTLISKYSPQITQGHLLDWGVGCGRVAQHFIHENKFLVTGIDIDSVNIDWCNRNIFNMNTLLVNLYPPVQLESNYFDIIISSSVLSHLVPEHWMSWLAEMSRVLKNNGVAFLSFHGDNSSTVMLSENKYALQSLSSEGWFNLNASIDLGLILEDYYRNTFFADNYARELFEKFFHVIDIVPGILSGSQSVAVLKARQGICK